MTNVKLILENAFLWVLRNRFEFFLLFLILLLAAILRLWKIDEYLPFMGDEGRDVRVVRRFLTDFDLMFVGPRTSIGDMYLGPLYYYLIAPFLLLFGFSPTGPAVFVALTSVATVALVWWVAKDWFGKVAGFSAALLYGLSPIVIMFSRHSWNPNVMPFFALLSVYAAWQVWRYHRFSWLVVVGIAVAFVLQSHYLGFLLFPALGLFWTLTLVRVRKTQKIKQFFSFSVFGFLFFLFLMLPLVLFDAKHGWHNAEAMAKFFFERQGTVSARPWNALPNIWPLWQGLVANLLAYKSQMGTWIAGLLIILAVWVGLDKRRMSGQTAALGILTAAIFIGLIGIGLLKQNVYDHYFGFLFAAPFLVFGFVCQGLWGKNLKLLVVFLLVIIVWLELSQSPLLIAPQRQMYRVQDINESILSDSGSKPFNFALIAERNYEEGYLYFFELWGSQVKEIDPLNTAETITDQLYVACEDLICEPINHRKAEIANFGWAKIDRQWEVAGTKIFKLVHTQ